MPGIEIKGFGIFSIWCSIFLSRALIYVCIARIDETEAADFTAAAIFAGCGERFLLFLAMNAVSSPKSMFSRFSGVSNSSKRVSVKCTLVV